VRKLLVVLSLIGMFALIADSASARPRGTRIARPAPKPAATTPIAARPLPRKDLRSEQERAHARPPRTWIVAMPPRRARSSSYNAADDAYPVASPAGEGAGDFAAATAPTSTPAAKAPEPKKAEPEKPVRMVVLTAEPKRHEPTPGPKLPHHFAICYWNQAGQCVAR
jgi:hypothetical protein